MGTNIIEFNKASKENYHRKRSSDEISEFNSTIIALQGMIVEMYATNENLSDLTSNLCTNENMFNYPVDSENIAKVSALVEFKKKEEKSMRLAA